MRIRTAHDLAAVARGRRVEQGWSQSEAARRAGVSRKWVSDFETGKASVELAAVLRLLDALDVTLRSGDPSSTDRPASTDDVDLDALLDDYLAR